jgi:hypothetical protein
MISIDGLKPALKETNNDMIVKNLYNEIIVQPAECLLMKN